MAEVEKVWVKDNCGNNVPVSRSFVRVILNPYGALYFCNGEKVRGIEHPMGMPMRKVLYSKSRLKNKNRY